VDFLEKPWSGITTANADTHLMDTLGRFPSAFRFQIGPLAALQVIGTIGLLPWPVLLSAQVDLRCLLDAKDAPIHKGYAADPGHREFPVDEGYHFASSRGIQFGTNTKRTPGIVRQWEQEIRPLLSQGARRICIRTFCSHLARSDFELPPHLLTRVFSFIVHSYQIALMDGILSNMGQTAEEFFAHPHVHLLQKEKISFVALRCGGRKDEVPTLY